MLKKKQKQTAQKSAIPKKILVLDIETSPNIGLFWRCGHKQSISHDQIIKERGIIMVAWKWLGHKESFVATWGQNQNDKKLLKLIQPLISKADAIIGHNSARFDLPWIQGRLAYHGLKPIPNRLNRVDLDTMKLVKSSMELNSNKLDYISKFLGFEGKKSMSYSDWFKICVHKDKTSLEKMADYNKEDIIQTEKVFFRVLPYVQLPTNIAMIVNPKTAPYSACPNCTSVEIRSDGTRTLSSGRTYRRLICKNCGNHFKGGIKK